MNGTGVWVVAAALPLVLLSGWVLGSLARLLLRGRARIGMAASIVVAILASSLGLLVAGWINPAAHVWSPLSVLLSLGCSVAGIAAYAAVAAHFQRPQRDSLADLVRAGESDRVEFKSTARVNLHTGAKDDRMEQVIAKTVAAFLNADGGTVVIGVDDTGTALGLDRDFGTLKTPDADRFELWLRDLFTTSLGQNAAALVEVGFADLPGADGTAVAVCRVTCRPSPRPVYLRWGRGTPAELWVRTGNSSRRLGVDEAAEYVMHRWPLNLGSSLAAQLRAAVRFSEEH